MVEKKRYWAGIFFAASFSYFLLDINQRWLSALWFYGWTDSSGEYTKGIFDEDNLKILFIINGIGLLIGLIFTILSLVTNKALRRRVLRLSSLLVVGVLIVFWVSRIRKVNKIELGTWKNVCNTNTIDAYSIYLERYPDGKFKKKAKQTIDWLNTESTNNPDSVRQFIASNPKSNNADDARIWLEEFKKDSLAWINAFSTYTTEAFEKYLNEFAQGIYREQALEEIEKIVGFAGEKGRFVDERNGIKYKWIRIGQQIWMAENLKFIIEDESGNQNSNSYYGGFYSWDVAQDCCPEGWHLPSDKEFNTLIAFLGGNSTAYKELIKGGRSGFELLLSGNWDFEGNDFTNNHKVTSHTENLNNSLTHTSNLLKRDPRTKDVANLYWDSKYNLYCKLTDEQILPNANKEYDIWYASHEEPYPHHKVLNKDELSSLLFYKFKDYETCKKWCDSKK